MDTPSRAPQGFHAYLALGALLSLTTWMLLLLPNYLKQEEWSSQSVGWVMGLYFLANVIFQTAAGRLSERYGSVRVAFWGAVVATASGVLYVAALWGTPLFFAARVVHAMGTGMVTAGALIGLVHSVPLHLKGRVIGYFGLPGFVMLGIGPAVAEAFIFNWGFLVTFVALTFFFFSMVIILLRLPRNLSGPDPSGGSFVDGLRLTVPRLKSVLLFSLLFGFCSSVWNSFLAPAVRVLGAGAVSAFGIGYGLGAAITRVSVSPRLDTGTRRLLAISSLVIYGVGLALIPAAGRRWHLGLLGMICGTSHGTFYPSLSSIATERFHPLHSGQGLGLYISASSLGMFMGPPAWGALADEIGLGRVFVAAGILLAVATVLFVVGQSRYKGLRRSSGTSTWETPLNEKSSFTR
ncbi:MAG: MFS transporter [Acidobacteria bacterium]|nr:MFS transporter [Acidobacteriota bacterium]